MTSNARKLVIIGCSGCGAHAAIMAKRLDPSLDVLIIREEERLLTRCALPYITAEEATLEASYKSDDMFTSNGIKLVDSRAESIDRKYKTVTTKDGNIYPYEKLVLATGGTPVKPKIPGFEMRGVFTVRTGHNTRDIRHWMSENWLLTRI